MQQVKFSECVGGEWQEESIPIDHILPAQSFQDSQMIEHLYNHGKVQGISSNKEGDRTCVSFDDAFILDNYPLKEKEEPLTQYAERVFGYMQDDNELTEDQILARDKMKQFQLNKEWKTMHAYHFPDFRLDNSGTKGFSQPRFETSTLRRKKEEEEEEEEEEKELQSFKRARGH